MEAIGLDRKSSALLQVQIEVNVLMCKLREPSEDPLELAIRALEAALEEG